MSSGSNNLYAFKEFTLDVGETVLLRNGKPVSVTPKAFHLLTILVEHHGAVVDKEKLISEIWADSIVEDGNLAFTAQLLRKVLGDDAKTPIYIETVPRKGYRFIAEVSTSPAPQDVRDTSQVERPSKIGRQRIALRIASAAFVVILITVGWFFVSRNGFATRSAPILLEPFKAARLSSTGSAVQAEISPNGKLVAYTDQTGNGKWSVWLRQISSAENIQILAPSELRYGGIAFSRDSNSLFMTRGDERLDIYRVNVFGGIPTKLVENTQGWISVSPDDKKISFVRCEYTTSDYCSLYVADIDGSNERRLVTRAKPIRIADNEFSPDGRSIAFAAGQSRTGSDDFQLFQVDVVTGMESAMTSQRFFNIKSLEWLPSGEELLFTGRSYAQQKFSIWKISASTGSVAQLTRDDGNFSELSLDDEARTLVVTKVDNNFTIYLQDVGDESNRRVLTPGSSCVFAPDGRIVFESNDRDIWIINADGNDKRQLTSDASADSYPLVTGDGSRIVFNSNRSGMNQVWGMNIDGSDQRQLTQTMGGYANFVAADGRLVYYTNDITRVLRKIDIAAGLESDLPQIVGANPAFSPDGNFVATFIRDTEGRRELTIRLQDLTDKEPVRSIRVGDNGTEPVQLEWSRDGQTIAYTVKRSGEYELWNLSLRLNKPVLIARLGSEPLEKVILSPDHRSIGTVRGSWLHDAYLISGLKF